VKQILQNIKNGRTEIVEVPVPVVRPGHILIATAESLVSAGTERMLLDFGKAGWIAKARQQPEKVKQVLEKMQTDGVLATVDAVFNKLDEPMPLGYCNAGVVLEVGPGIKDIVPGDRVASNGSHAEIVCVPGNLCVKIPQNVSSEHAAFTVLGSIALQSIRLARPDLGEKFIVFGLGLVGLLAVQLLRANGCSVLAVDMNEKRLELARKFGAQVVNASDNDPVAAASAFSSGKGVDGVIIAASAKGDDIIHQAAQSCRKRARIVLVGVVDLNLLRSDFYEKEISFQVSCSYGPGRYDESYELSGHDYPFGYVRWTEQRNMEAVLEAISNGSLDIESLISERIDFENIADEYDRILHEKDSLGIVIRYPQSPTRSLPAQSSESVEYKHVSETGHDIGSPSLKKGVGKARIGIIGAGGFAKSILIPALISADADVLLIADLNSVGANHAARKFNSSKAVSDYRYILDDSDINTVFIVVGHHLHSRFVSEALDAGKNVFVEKPLAISREGLAEVEDAVRRNPELHLMVGFNRRFSPHTQKIVSALKGRKGPLCMNMTVNAGAIPADHWIQDPLRGGGRIIGECCHFMDLLSFIAGSPIEAVKSVMAGGNEQVKDDKMIISLAFEDGSIGTVNYFSNGSKSYPKEMLEVFSDSRVIRMENFRVTKGYGFKSFRTFRTLRQDKGHNSEIESFIKSVEVGGLPLVPFSALVNVTAGSFDAVESARNFRKTDID
jgi:predicted dehydrogenase/threonine dehydrogenase-like Zn-dependent dehydrogenase